MIGASLDLNVILQRFSPTELVATYDKYLQKASRMNAEGSQGILDAIVVYPTL